MSFSELEMKQQVNEYLNRYVDFEEEEINQFYSLLQHRVFPKKSYLLRAGKTCKHKFFLIKGLVRCFYIDDHGTDRTVQFAIENWWVTSMESFLKEKPSQVSIQAMEDTEVLMLSKNNLNELYEAIPKLERLFRITTENMLVAIQNRHEFYMKKSGREKYDLILEHIPQLAQRVPQYILASYLEMTPEHLSALRKTVR